ncbi:hypothetical protein Tco_0542374 [Tanacetum coccineum]
MLQKFPLTLIETAKRCLGRTSSDLLKTWDELKRFFIRRFCPPFVTFKQIGEIHNFRQEEGETLYQTWEIFNDLLFKCPFHDLNDYHKVNTFYKGLSFHTCQILDSRGLITGLTAAEDLESIQEIVEHSHRWHKEESDKKTSNNSLSTITDKLKNLNHDMEFHHEKVKSMRTREARQVNQKFTYPFDNLKETFEQYLEESRKRQNILDKWMQNFMENTNKNLQIHESTIKKLEKIDVRLAYILAEQKNSAPVMNDIPYASTFVQLPMRRLDFPSETANQKLSLKR